MNGSGKFAALVALSALTATSTPVKAADASFGCQVLLCAAAVSPAWPAIPYCVPPMTQLFRILSKGGSWPSCAEAGTTGGVGYQPYQACPDGQTGYAQAINAEGSAYGWTPDANGGYCASASNPPATYCTDSGCMTTGDTPQAREVNAKPYFVDITKTGGTPQRFFFALTGQ